MFLRTTALRQTVRGFASAASNSVKPPVQLFGLDGSYASALYTASVKNSSIETTEKSLGALKNLIEKDQKLNTVVENPSLSTEDKKQLVKTITESANVDQTTGNFLNVLAENNRLGLIGSVIKQFETLSNAHHGLVEATVTSADALDKKTISRLEAAISKSEFVGQGQKLKLANKVNPDVLGGLIVEVGDRTVDLSVSNKISKLNKLLTDAI
jgi:F-type H+-transporting ATPase subunit O